MDVTAERENENHLHISLRANRLCFGMFFTIQSDLELVPTDSDRVAVIIPVYNDPDGLETTLGSILTNTTHPRYTIHIVDNNSTDNTAAVAQQYTDRDHVYLHNETDIQSSYAARNTGFTQTSEPILVFLDADQRVVDGWLETCVDYMLDNDVDYLAPNIALEAPADPSLTARYNLVSGFPIEQFISEHHYAPTSCLFVTRELLDDIGRFDERLVSGGDLEFGNRAHEAGYNLGFCPDATVIHPTRNSFRSLFGRNIRIGKGHCQLQRYYPDRYGRVGIPPRPSGIREEQYDGSLNRGLYNAIALTMTAARGIGYYRELLSVLKHRLGRPFG